MPGSLAQLNAYGTQDTYLTGDPTISFWKQKIKTYTAFAKEGVQCVWNNGVGFGKRSTAILPRTGDLVSQMWLEIDLPDLSLFTPTPNTATNIKWANSIALIMLSTIQLDMGTVRLDRYPGYYADFWSELTEKAEKEAAFRQMVGKFDKFDNTSAVNSSSAARTYFVPLLFFPNASSSLAIPYAALQFSEIRVNMELRNYLDCVVSSMAPVQSLVDQAGNALEVGDVRLYVEYVYLDAPEKQRFVSLDHDILFTSLQETGQNAVLAGTTSFKLELKQFSNLLSELVFVFQPKVKASSNTMTGNDWTACLDAFAKVDLQVDGSSRFAPRSGRWFYQAEPYMHHGRCPTKPVHSYSLALHPEAVQPSGTINASRVSSLFFNFTMKPGLPDGFVNVFARTLNVLTISQGLAELKFA